ncbi:MAG: HDIG domain-containing protein, partial [Akkermansia sp.]
MLQFKFISQFVERTGLSQLAKKLEGDSRLMSLIALLSIFALCCMASSFTPDGQAALFRIIWICLVSIALIFLYCSGVYASDISSSRSLLILFLILAQLFSIPLIFTAQGYIPINIPPNFALLFIPWIVAPGITSILIGRRMGMFVTLCVALLGTALCPAHDGHNSQAIYLVSCMLTGVASSLLCGRVHKREHVLYAGFVVGLIAFASSFLLGRLYLEVLHTDHVGLNYSWLAMELIAAVGMSFMYAVYVGGIMPVLERLFNISTPITWLELGDMNHKLLKELQLQAPGTFHHCIVVSRLAESAAEAIGADPTHSAVCALFHDIGKLKNPQYFAENINDSMTSPHDELTPDMSAKIINNHVTDGVELALINGLNSRIVDVIREHHGVSSAYFFYRKALEHYEAEMARFEAGKIDTAPKAVCIKDFSYKGPIPQSKESGIVSMADAVESATRSLRNPTEADIKDMIASIFKGRILDGHLNDSQLTLGDLDILKDSFFISIKSMHHNRIAYPKPKEE